METPWASVISCKLKCRTDFGSHAIFQSCIGRSTGVGSSIIRGFYRRCYKCQSQGGMRIDLIFSCPYCYYLFHFSLASDFPLLIRNKNNRASNCYTVLQWTLKTINNQGSPTQINGDNSSSLSRFKQSNEVIQLIVDRKSDSRSIPMEIEVS